MTTTAVLPLFPLKTVLFPGGPLSLRIFEPRYVDMVSRCMREGSPFGVVLIRSGAEVGPVETADTGSTARIVDFFTLPEGLLGISCHGERKFHLVRRWQQSDGLNLGEVCYAPPEETRQMPEQYRPLGELLRKILPQLESAYGGMEAHYEDASWVGSRLAEILPIDLTHRLALLELSDPLARLEQLGALLPQ
jgi:uncharacterized protein